MHVLALLALVPTQLGPAALEVLERAPAQDVASVFPASETEVPANGRLLFFGGAVGDLSFVRTLGDGAEETLAHTSAPVDQFQSVHTVTLPADLVAGESLVVSARCGACFFSGTWTVGAPDEEPPAFDDGPSEIVVQPIANDGSPFWAASPTTSFVLDVRLPGARDARSPVALELRSDVVTRLGPETFGPGQAISVLVEVLSGAAQTVCFDAIVTDAAGNEAALDEQVCADLEPASGGCAQTSPSTSWLALVVLAVLAVLTAARKGASPARVASRRSRVASGALGVWAVVVASSSAQAAPVAPGIADQEALVALPQVDFSTAVPSQGAEIPTNARLLVFGSRFEDQPTEVVFERFFGLEKTTLDVEVLDGSGLNEAAYLVDLGELVPGELVQVGCSACFDNWSATVVDEVDERAPVFAAGNKNRIGVTDMGEVGYQVRACVPAVRDDGAGVALRVVTDVNEAFAHAFQGGCTASELEVAVFAAGEARTFCWQTLAVDAAGNEALFHEDVCVDLPAHLEETGGCTQVPAAAIAPFALALVAFRRRRRVPLAAGGALVAATSSAALPEQLPRRDVIDSFPAQDAALPLNARLVLFGLDNDDISFVRVRPNGGETALAHDKIVGAEDAAYLVTLDELVAGELVIIESRCAECMFVGTWTVGEAIDDEAPVFGGDGDEATAAVVEDVVVIKRYGIAGVLGYDLSIVLPRVGDDNSPSLILLAGDGLLGHSVQPSIVDTVDVFVPGEEARTVCMSVVVVDAAGNETAHPDELCADVDPHADGGCTQVPASTFAPVALALRRRTRRGFSS